MEEVLDRDRYAVQRSAVAAERISASACFASAAAISSVTAR
jgi:hypothetical protein